MQPEAHPETSPKVSHPRLGPPGPGAWTTRGVPDPVAPRLALEREPLAAAGCRGRRGGPLGSHDHLGHTFFSMMK